MPARNLGTGAGQGQHQGPGQGRQARHARRNRHHPGQGRPREHHRPRPRRHATEGDGREETLGEEKAAPAHPDAQVDGGQVHGQEERPHVKQSVTRGREGAAQATPTGEEGPGEEAEHGQLAGVGQLVPAHGDERGGGREQEEGAGAGDPRCRRPLRGWWRWLGEHAPRIGRCGARAYPV